MPFQAKARLVIQGQNCPDNAQAFGADRFSCSASNGTDIFPSLGGVFRMVDRLRGLNASCAFSSGQPREIQDALKWSLLPNSDFSSLK